MNFRFVLLMLSHGFQIPSKSSQPFADSITSYDEVHHNIRRSLEEASFISPCDSERDGISCNITEDEGSSEEHEITTLQNLCQMFLIPQQNCTCQNKFIIEVLRILAVTECPSDNSTLIPRGKIYNLRYNSILSRTYAGVTTLIVLIALIGNSFVIAVNISKQSLTSYQGLITQLAVWDLMFSVVHLIVVTPKFWTNKWLFGSVACKILNSLITLGSIVAIGVIVIVCVERYIGIVYPVKYANLKHVSMRISAVNVVIGLFHVAPLTWYLDIGPLKTCEPLWPLLFNKIYSIYLLIVCTLLPIITVAVLHSVLIRVLRKKLLRNEFEFKHDSTQYIKRLQTNIRIMKILMSTTIVYASVILPYRIITLYLLFQNQPPLKYSISATQNPLVSDDTYIALTFVALLPYPLHVAVNPIIYSFVDPKWRKDFKAIYKRFIRFSRSSTVNRYLGPSVDQYRVTPKERSATQETCDM